jgi:hypothetical protein
MANSNFFALLVVITQWITEDTTRFSVVEFQF